MQECQPLFPRVIDCVAHTAASKQILDVIYSLAHDVHRPVKWRIYAFRDNKIRDRMNF